MESSISLFSLDGVHPNDAQEEPATVFLPDGTTKDAIQKLYDAIAALLQERRTDGQPLKISDYLFQKIYYC